MGHSAPKQHAREGGGCGPVVVNRNLPTSVLSLSDLCGAARVSVDSAKTVYWLPCIGCQIWYDVSAAAVVRRCFACMQEANRRGLIDARLFRYPHFIPVCVPSTSLLFCCAGQKNSSSAARFLFVFLPCHASCAPSRRFEVIAFLGCRAFLSGSTQFGATLL